MIEKTEDVEYCQRLRLHKAVERALKVMRSFPSNREAPSVPGAKKRACKEAFCPGPCPYVTWMDPVIFAFVFLSTLP